MCGRYSKVSSHPETQVPIALRKAQGAPPLPEYIFFISTSFPKICNKKRRCPLWISPYINLILTSYDGIIHIRYKGRRCRLPLSLPHRLPRILSCDNKNRKQPFTALPVKNPVYDFLRRHYPYQVKGSKLGYFLSACFTSSPVFI